MAGEDPTPAARLPAGTFVGGAGAMAADFKVGDRVRVTSVRITDPPRRACACNTRTDNGSPRITQRQGRAGSLRNLPRT